jgi:hypothetical protein
MKVSIERLDKAVELQKDVKYFRVVTTEAYGMYCTEVFHPKGVTRAFNRVHELAVNNAVNKSIKTLEIS